MIKQISVLLAVSISAFACRAPERSETAAPPAAETAATTSADYDLQFIDMMTKHHQIAVQMAKMAPEKASDGTIKETAREIIEDQTKEIAQLQLWRNQWYPGAAETANMSLAGASSANMDMSHMQGISGHQFDMMFVDMMIPHHKGAIEMAREALQKAQHPEIKTFAEQVIAKQEKEIAQLEQWKKSMKMTSLRPRTVRTL